MVVMAICQRCDFLLFLEDQFTRDVAYSSMLSNVYLTMSRQKIEKRKRVTTTFSFDTSQEFLSTFCFRHKYIGKTLPGFSNYADVCLKTLNNDPELVAQLRLHQDRFYYVFIKNNFKLGRVEPYDYFVGKAYPTKFSRYYIHWLVDFPFHPATAWHVREDILAYNECTCDH